MFQIEYIVTGSKFELCHNLATAKHYLNLHRARVSASDAQRYKIRDLSTGLFLAL